MSVADTTNLEKQSLEAHVDLCAMRYMNLEARLNILEAKMDGLQKEIIEGQKSLKTVIITSTATIISGIIGLIVTIILAT